MMKRLHYILWGRLILPLIFAACDSGDIAENTYYSSATGQTVRLTATLTGTDAWEAGDYTIALAGFRDGSNYAVMQHTLPVSVADAVPVVLELNNLTGQVNTVEFAVTDRLRQRILTLQRITLADYPDTQDTIRMDLGSIDVSLFGCLQRGILDKACIQCHGGNGRMAGSLDLTAGHSWNNLVNVRSALLDEWRVKGGDADSSLIWKILNEGGENMLHYNHTEVLSSQFKENLDEVKKVIADWINGL
jgi:hypothetical protein